jgi:hypothetical protein
LSTREFEERALNHMVKRITVGRPWPGGILLPARALILERCYQCSSSDHDATEATATSPILKEGDRWLPLLVLFAR